MTSFRTLICTLCLLPLAGAASAQSGDAAGPGDSAPVDRMRMAVGTYAAEYLGGYGDLFEPQMLVRMGGVAQQRAIAQTCEGFDVDMERYNDVMSGIMAPVLAKTETPADGGPAINLPFTIANSAYSMVLGGYIAVGAADPDALCTIGDEMRASFAEGDAEAVLIWSDAN